MYFNHFLFLNSDYKWLISNQDTSVSISLQPYNTNSTSERNVQPERQQKSSTSIFIRFLVICNSMVILAPVVKNAKNVKNIIDRCGWNWFGQKVWNKMCRDACCFSKNSQLFIIIIILHVYVLNEFHLSESTFLCVCVRFFSVLKW